MSIKSVGLIPIKLNNQRLPGKNTMKLGNKPLCAYLFDTLKAVKSLDEVYVFCSDEAFQEYVPEHIHFLKRPVDLDSPTTKSKDLLNWFLSRVPADIYALLHVTQPFVSAQSIDVCVNKVKSGLHDSSFVVKEIREFAWFHEQPLNYCFDNVVPTQNLDPLYIECEVFVFARQVFEQHQRRIGFTPYLHTVNWIEGVSIDTPEDFALAQATLSMLGSQRKMEA